MKKPKHKSAPKLTAAKRAQTIQQHKAFWKKILLGNKVKKLIWQTSASQIRLSRVVMSNGAEIHLSDRDLKVARG